MSGARRPSVETTPLAERLRRRNSGNHRTLPSWLEAQNTPVRTRPLRAHSQPLAPVQPIEDLVRVAVEQQVDEARQEAELEGLRIAEEKVGTTIERYLDGIKRLGDLSREARRPDPAEVVDLALTVAAELIRREISLDRDLLVRTIGEALTNATVDRQLVVRLAPEDVEHVRRRRPDLLEAGVTVIDDRRLQPGDYELETPQQVVDGAIAGRLENVREALVALVSEHGAAAPALDGSPGLPEAFE